MRPMMTSMLVALLVMVVGCGKDAKQPNLAPPQDEMATAAAETDEFDGVATLDDLAAVRTATAETRAAEEAAAVEEAKAPDARPFKSLSKAEKRVRHEKQVDEMYEKYKVQRAKQELADKNQARRARIFTVGETRQGRNLPDSPEHWNPIMKRYERP